MKPRSLQTAREIAQTRALIERRLDRLAFETQPEVAAAILQLTGDKSAGLAEFARVIRGDSALAARVLRQSNSAYFRQADPVVDLDRACVVLGSDRLRAVAVGFTLDRADPASRERRLARRVWRQSIMRGCIAGALCERACPRLAPVGLVVGLMLDAGQPVLARLLGEPALSVLERDLPPHAGLAAEARELPFTHVDVVSILCERWKLPPILAHAIELHHTAVRDGGDTGDAGVLRRVAAVAGLVELDARTSQARVGDLVPALTERVLGLSGSSLREVLAEAEREFARLKKQLVSAAVGADDLEALASRIRQQVDVAVDQMLTDALRHDGGPDARAISLGGSVVEVEHGGDGRWSVFLLDSAGARIARHEVRPGDGVEAVYDGLALEHRAGDQVEALGRVLRLVA